MVIKQNRGDFGMGKMVPWNTKSTGQSTKAAGCMCVGSLFLSAVLLSSYGNKTE